MESSKKNKYTIEEKLKVLEKIKTNSIHSIAKKYGIDRSSIRDWQKQEDKLKSQTNFRKFRIEGAGAKFELPKEKKDELISWILQNQKLNLSITTSILIKYLLKIYPAFSNKKEHTLKKWCYTFLKNNDFVIRKASHIGQSLPFDYANQITMFLKEIIFKRKHLNIDDNNLDLIINVDETPLYFDAPFDTTIEKKGIKEVKINTSGFEKERLSLLLSITVSGTKLMPIIIFKG